MTITVTDLALSAALAFVVGGFLGFVVSETFGVIRDLRRSLATSARPAEQGESDAQEESSPR